MNKKTRKEKSTKNGGENSCQERFFNELHRFEIHIDYSKAK